MVSGDVGDCYRRGQDAACPQVARAGRVERLGLAHRFEEPWAWSGVKLRAVDRVSHGRYAIGHENPSGGCEVSGPVQTTVHRKGGEEHLAQQWDAERLKREHDVLQWVVGWESRQDRR